MSWQASATLLPASNTTALQHSGYRTAGQVQSSAKALVLRHGNAGRHGGASAAEQLLGSGNAAGSITWQPQLGSTRGAGGGGRRKPHSGSPALVCQGLGLLQQLLAAPASGSHSLSIGTTASAIALASRGALPAAAGGFEIAGGSRREWQQSAAAAAWGLARVAALEYAHCRWSGVDDSPYAAHATSTQARMVAWPALPQVSDCQRCVGLSLSSTIYTRLAAHDHVSCVNVEDLSPASRTARKIPAPRPCAWRSVDLNAQVVRRRRVHIACQRVQ